jgi:glutamyl-tRNA reductase
MRRRAPTYLASSWRSIRPPAMTPTLFLVGATHRTAPFGFREKLALGPEGEAALAAELRLIPSLGEFVILNTCNRVEIYGVALAPQTASAVPASFCALRHVEPAEFARFGFTLVGRAAVEHLLTVSAGLDSQILGETEIFGQVKRAYAAAQTRGSVGPLLNRLFQKAFQAAKHVRTHTGVTTGQISVANIAVELALTVFGDVKDAKILLLGAGEMAEKSARAFQSRGATQLTVASRRLDPAESLAARFSGNVIAFTDRDQRLAEFDIVVCSTAATTTVISRDAVRAAMDQRRARPLLFIDLAMPRDVDAAVSDIDNVFLYNLDDLARVAAKNRQSRRTEAEAGRLTLATRTLAIWSVLQVQIATLAAAPAQPSNEHLPVLDGSRRAPAF